MIVTNGETLVGSLPGIGDEDQVTKEDKVWSID